MRVKCLTQEGYAHTPRDVKKGHTAMTTYDQVEIGRVYPVCGIVSYEEGIRYLIYDECEIAYWFPAELFEVVDSRMPSNWHFQFNGNDEPVSALCGYKELMSDDHFDGLAELEPEDKEIFLRALADMYGDVSEDEN